jgi:hypothetical protein
MQNGMSLLADRAFCHVLDAWKVSPGVAPEIFKEPKCFEEVLKRLPSQQQ